MRNFWFDSKNAWDDRRKIPSMIADSRPPHSAEIIHARDQDALWLHAFLSGGGGVRGVMKTMAVAFRTPDNERGVS